jgi:hypothetical protein
MLSKVTSQFGLPLADLIQQASILHCYHRLRSEVLQQRNFLLRKRSHLDPASGNDTEQRTIPT